ncbi:MAG: SseB family protein [Lachnospiraceae bacterium]
MSEQKFDNTKLLETMRVFTADKTHEHMLDIMRQIRMSMVMVPATFPEEGDVNRLKEANGKPVAVPPGTKFQPQLIKNKKDEKYLPIFTDPAQIPKEQEYPTIVTMPFLECAAMTNMKKEIIKGIALNPFTENILFQQELLEAMLLAEKELQGQRVVPVSQQNYHRLVRHRAEHVELPQAVHSGGQKFIQTLEKEAEPMILSLYRKGYDEKMTCPYSEDDFSIMSLNIGEDLELTRIDLPHKHLAKEIAIRVYLTVNPQTNQTGYFLIEGAEEKNTFQLSKILADGTYQVLQEAPGEGTELQTVIDLARAE